MEFLGHDVNGIFSRTRGHLRRRFDQREREREKNGATDEKMAFGWEKSNPAGRNNFFLGEKSNAGGTGGGAARATYFNHNVGIEDIGREENPEDIVD